MNRLLFIFLFGFFGNLQGLQKPLVILPTAIRWNAGNSITVVPRDWSSGPLDIYITIYIKDQGYEKQELFKEYRQVSITGSSETFTFHTAQKPDVTEYEIQINVTGHAPYSTILFGGPDIKFISLETDKGYYSPGESVNLRILPVTESGDIFRFPLKASLVNVQGFKVITDVVLPKNTYIKHSFTVPEFAENGTWIVTVAPVNLTLPWMLSQKKIIVQRYSKALVREPKFFIVLALPKFLVTMSVRDSESKPDVAVVDIYAKYPNGAPVTATVAVSCKDEPQIRGLVVGLSS